ncbi:DUF397 domain-containing protein [Saccharothrix isguenensis]
MIGSGTQENCVEVAVATDEVGVRHSKQAAGPEPAFPSTAFTAFLRDVKL